MTEFSELLRAIAAFLWPVLGFIALLLFRPDLSRILRRLRKGKLLGQEIELDQELRTLAETTREATTEVLERPGAQPALDVSDKSRSVFERAAQSPRAALAVLAADIEMELRQLARRQDVYISARRGAPELAQAVLRDSPKLVESIRRFWPIRNQIVHGHDVPPPDALRAIDSGIEILEAIRATRSDNDAG